MALAVIVMPSNNAKADYYTSFTGGTPNPNYVSGYGGSVWNSNGYSNTNTYSSGNGSNSGYNGSCQNCGANGNGNNGNNNGTSNVDVKPYVTTEPAIDITNTSALIQGSTHIDTGSATVWFEWGTHVDRLDHTTRTNYISPSSTGTSEVITTLTVGTKYYFRIAAHNATGTTYGIVRSFTTKGGVAASTSTRNGTIATASASTVYTDPTVKGSLSAAAANSGSSNGFVPSSILGWLLVIVLVFLIVVIVRAIQREAEERKKREEEMKKKLATA